MTNTYAVDKSAYGNNKLAQWGIADDQMSNAQKWICFWALFAFGACCVYQWQMLAPILVNIAAEFNIATANIGWLMSIYALAGLILAYPCTWIMQTFGIKFSLVVTAVLGILGNIICLFADGATMFMVGRAVQGCGFGLIAVLGPNIMPRLFPLEKQGLIMGIWSQWVTPGIALGSLTTAPLYQSGGWTAVFYLSTILTVVFSILLIILVKFPLVPENVLHVNAMEAAAAKAPEKSTGKIYVASAFIVGFSFVAWCAVYGTFNSFYPTFGQQELGMSMMSASLFPFITAMVTIPSGIFIGWLADRIRRRKVLLLVGYAILFVLYGFFIWKVTGVAGAWTCAIILGFVCAALVPTMTRAIIPVLAQKPKETDWALTGMAFVTQIGSFISAFFATLMAGRGWGFAGLIFAFIILAVFIVLIFVKDDHNIILTNDKDDQAA